MKIRNLINKYQRQLERSHILEKIDLYDNMMGQRVHVGIDIGAYSIKLVQIEKTIKGLVLSTIGYKDIPHSTDPETSSAQGDIVIQILNELWHECHIKTRRIKLVISDPAIYTRHITIPRVSEEELVKAIKWQAEKYAPFPIEHALVDFQILQGRQEDSEKNMEIIVIAAERRTIDKYLSYLKAVRLIPTSINFSPFAVGQSFLMNYPVQDNRMTPLIEIGTYTTSVIIFRGKNLRLVRNIDIAGSTFTRVIAESLNVSRAKAESIKCQTAVVTSREGADEQQAKVSTMMQSKLKELVGQIDRSFAYCERDFISESVSKVLLCGGGSKLKGLDQYLSQQLGLAVEKANPFQNLSLSNKLDSKFNLGDYASQMMAVVGEVI